MYIKPITQRRSGKLWTADLGPSLNNPALRSTHLSLVQVSMTGRVRITLRSAPESKDKSLEISTTIEELREVLAFAEEQVAAGRMAR